MPDDERYCKKCSSDSRAARVRLVPLTETSNGKSFADFVLPWRGVKERRVDDYKVTEVHGMFREDKRFCRVAEVRVGQSKEEALVRCYKEACGVDARWAVCSQCGYFNIWMDLDRKGKLRSYAPGLLPSDVQDNLKKKFGLKRKVSSSAPGKPSGHSPAEADEAANRSTGLPDKGQEGKGEDGCRGKGDSEGAAKEKSYDERVYAAELLLQLSRTSSGSGDHSPKRKSDGSGGQGTSKESKACKSTGDPKKEASETKGGKVTPGSKPNATVVKEESPKPILHTVNVEEKLQEKLLFSYDQTQDVNVNVNSLDCSSLQASNAKKRKTSNLCQTIENGMQCATKNAGC
ncbi:hypothetical protein GUITHDRAFT_142916 [Guillardia theta CCMP2712]|uniref:Uncharacterized protein n=1 Tax=Guillardia theta (strain CCMP2712) TaxID=905079 RepID=L1IVB4_GUITC|nr:hypothetical protein GUITHDRAFT_142916 [Guillardia theta CCMP2712]EKX40193.1 hypothetical protein GUITHDRAFT_142916 [Guillardia theta CCMP2712]|eukprot:XP_005827173.1 hypothetical protein GUITHDRAFT_142916 [Guillardia theta CCMP2712]